MLVNFYRLRLENIIIILTIFISVNSKSVDEYDELISRADIFYVPPNPNSNPTEIRISELSSVRNRKNIKIIIHGYWGHMNHVAIQPLRFAYLHKGHDSLYMADYRDAAEIFYLTSRYFVERLGQRFAIILDEFMKKHQIDPADVHIMGHSMASHISGMIGRYFKGKIGRITALDPSGPLFYPDSSDALQPSDALFVEAIHSASPVFGAITPRGHVDFYPNYGLVFQPGCTLLDFSLLSSCSHFRAPLFYAESILLPNSFPSISCSFKNILKRKCEEHTTSKLVMMGEDIDQRTRGTFYLKTNNVPPYGMGYNSPVLNQTKINYNETIMAG